MHPVMRSFQPSAKALHKRSCDEFTSGNFEFDAQESTVRSPLVRKPRRPEHTFLQDRVSAIVNHGQPVSKNSV
jgi:hypothetical protein